MVLVGAVLVGWVLLGVPVAFALGRAARLGAGQTRLPGGPAAPAPHPRPAPVHRGQHHSGPAAA